MLMKSRKMYKQKQYFTRKRLPSYHNKTSKYIRRARKIYGIETIQPDQNLANATGCSIDALEQIVRKGEGAYFSSGSRPNQTAQSWGIARLASAVTGGKAAAVDFHILDQGCNHQKTAFQMAKESVRKNKHGKHGVPHVIYNGQNK
jgi:hypothetical protein